MLAKQYRLFVMYLFSKTLLKLYDMKSHQFCLISDIP